ncbi:MAG: hypothetical protein CL663_08515 [Bacteroidetes bacterium]|nr:hypothetical protein [Bacteroidota bacterium]
MNPIEIVKQLKGFNDLFVQKTGKDYFSAYQESQAPIITLVTCADSRVQTDSIVEDATNKIFTIRNIGNQIYSNEGSVDYGILHLKTPILLIMGHADCGAVKAYMGGYSSEPASIKTELDHLTPAINGSNTNLLKTIVKNVNYQVSVALEKYAEIIGNHELMVVGAVYDFKNEIGEGFGKFKVVNINGDDKI